MVDFGKGFLIVDSYNTPWLVWIQMFVFFLLLLLLFFFGILSSDINTDSVPSSSNSSLYQRFYPGDPIQISHNGFLRVNSSFAQSNQMGSSQAIKGEIEPAATRMVTITEEEEEECSSSSLYHPCNLFQLAGTVFLKCFGIDRRTEETDDNTLRPESKKPR